MRRLKGKSVQNRRFLLPAVYLLAGLLVLLLDGHYARAWLTSIARFEQKFEKAEVSFEVVSRHNQDKNRVESIQIKNTGTIDLYVRTVTTWRAESETGEILAYQPEAGIDYEFSNSAGNPLGNGWFEKGGFHYFEQAVSPGTMTDPLFAPVTVLKVPLKSLDDMDFYLCIDVAVQVIQALPGRAVESIWPVVRESGGTLAPAEEP